MSDATSDDIKELHKRVTEQVVETAALGAKVDANTNVTSRLITVLQGNGQPGIVKTVTEHGTRLDSIEVDRTDRRDTQWKTISTIVAMIGLVAVFIALLVDITFHLIG